MDINEAIQHCLDVAEQQGKGLYDAIAFGGISQQEANDCEQCIDDHKQLAQWLMELKDLRGAQNDQYVFIHELMNELKEAKSLLKLAMEDIYKARQGFGCSICDMPKDSIDRCDVDNVSKDCKFVWKYTNEAKKLLGEEV